MSRQAADLESLFQRASRHAERDENEESAKAYEALLKEVQRPDLNLPAADRAKLFRSAVFNLAQVLNKLGNYQRALQYVTLGLTHGPTDVGKAIALAAKGEALCGLGREAEGKMAFAEAMQAHPIIGRLNAADSMARLGTPAFLQRAEELIEIVLSSFGNALPEKLFGEATSIRRIIVARRQNVERTPH